MIECRNKNRTKIVLKPKGKLYTVKILVSYKVGMIDYDYDFIGGVFTDKKEAEDCKNSLEQDFKLDKKLFINKRIEEECRPKNNDDDVIWKVINSDIVEHNTNCFYNNVITIFVNFSVTEINTNEPTKGERK